MRCLSLPLRLYGCAIKISKAIVHHVAQAAAALTALTATAPLALAPSPSSCRCCGPRPCCRRYCEYHHVIVAATAVAVSSPPPLLPPPRQLCNFLPALREEEEREDTTTEIQQPHENILNRRGLCSTKSLTAKKTKGEAVTHWQVPVLEAQVQQTANAPYPCVWRT